MDCSTPGFPVLHHPGACSNACSLSPWCHPTILSSAIPFSSCLQSFPAQGLFQWVSSLHPVAKVLELQHQPFQWIFRVDFFWDWLVWSPCSPRDSQESSPAPVFFSAQPSSWSNSHIHSWLLKKPWLLLYRPLLAKGCLCFLICCLGWSQLFFQRTSIFYFHGCNHHLQWFWSPRK